MLEVVDSLLRPLHNFMLNACFTIQLDDINNDTQTTVTEVIFLS